jgi:anti-sigma factor RsiW
MTCAQIEPELVAYHFGLVSSDTRDLVEPHLASCSACLRAFLELKRAIETGDHGVQPSKASRSRLRSAVAAELGARTRAEVESRRRWWERPLAVAVAASVVLAAGATTRALTSGRGSPPYALSQGSAPR